MIPHDQPVPRHTGRGIVVRDGKILLMERWRPRLHYFSVPGGGIEDGETPEQAAIREIAEETTIQATIVREVLQMRDGTRRHHIFLCEYIDGEPAMPDDAPEALTCTPNNRFKPGWFSIDEVQNMDMIYWQPIKQKLLYGLEHGFSDEVAVVSTDASG